MSWQDQNYGGGGYSNYGNYNDGQFGGDSASYDMFDDSSAQNAYSDSGFGGASSGAGGGGGFYNPNAYQQQTDSSAAYRPPSQTGQAYQRGPTPPNTYESANQMPPKQQPDPQGYPGGPQVGINTLINNPMMTGMAMQYGQDFVGRGGEEIKKNLDKYVSIGQLKYYFAVDTSYVARKLGVLLFPFTKTDWAIKYNQDEPVQPKYDVNAPDLYIPTMSYATYVLLVGYILGLRNAFSPDALSTTASFALVGLILEIGFIYLCLTVMSINTSLTKWDILSFSSYKYVGIIVVLLLGLLLNSKGYYVGLIYVSASIMFFLLRTLKLRIEPEVHGMQVHGKRNLYVIVMYALFQPFLIWWMTYSLVPISSSIDIPAPPSDHMPFQEP